MDKCRVDVNICGNSYVLAAEKSEERIMEIARFVDDELRHTSKVLNSYPNYKCAVLTSLNIAEKLMDSSDLLNNLQEEKKDLEGEIQNYKDKLEEAKEATLDAEGKLSEEADKLNQKDDVINMLKDKLSEMENAYFDLQMENVNLKNELKNLKKLGTEDEL